MAFQGRRTPIPHNKKIQYTFLSSGGISSSASAATTFGDSIAEELGVGSAEAFTTLGYPVLGSVIAVSFMSLS